ncbi:MAG: lamin tail domain-containing protein [Patescibacteria group bacterium]|nr:lamin tail domain-containing protein [Patescibacteria group bacterium]
MTEHPSSGWMTRKNGRLTFSKKQMLFFGSALIVMSAFLFANFSKAQLEEAESDVKEEEIEEIIEEEEDEKRILEDEEMEKDTKERTENEIEQNDDGYEKSKELKENNEGNKEESEGENDEEAVGEETENQAKESFQVVQDQVKQVSEKRAEKKDEESEVEFGDVMINEVAWMGTEISGNDEWIELKNETDEKIELDDWILEAEDGTPKIKFSGDISGEGYYLLERTDDFSVPDVEADQVYTGALENGGEHLKLKNKEGDLIDEINSENDWPAGKNETKKTMERNDKGEWQDSRCFGGTPRAENRADGLCEGQSDEDEELLKDIVINELLPDPVGLDTKGEWIELYNTGIEDVVLSDCYLRDLTRRFIFSNQTISALSFLVLSYKETKISLNNSGDMIKFFSPSGQMLESISYGKVPDSGYSWARKMSEEYVWTSTPTPGEDNNFPVPQVYSSFMKFNEVLPNPVGIDKNNEWVELKNNDTQEVDLTGWMIENGSKKSYMIEKGKALSGELFMIRIENSSMSIRNSKEQLSLLDPNGEVADVVSYVESAGSGLSLNVNEQKQWKWSRFLTPEKENRFNNLPKIKIIKPKKVYKNIYAEFDASKTTDEDGDELKFRWDFGNGHRSYLEETRHKYEKKGKYKVILTVDDGSEEVFKSFRVEVKSFPRRELILTRLMPNPDGKDKGNEIIVIKNLYKKKINLEDFKISTGSCKSKMVNHLIYNDFIIRPGKEKAIFNDDICKFSLLNKKGVVVLRYPDGKIADIVFYEKKKIAPNEEYVLTDVGWKWIGGNVGDESKKDVVLKEKVAGIEAEKIFDFLLITKNEKERICECLRKIMIENWKNNNLVWLSFVS